MSEHLDAPDSPRSRIAIVTQDPLNRGGVLRLVEYIYQRALAAGLEPTLLHYASFKGWPNLSVSLMNAASGEFNLTPKSHHYQFEGMNAIAIGARFPEYPPQRIGRNALWDKALASFDRAILVTGSAQTGFPLVGQDLSFVAWVSAIVDEDRRERLSHAAGVEASVERATLGQIKRAELAVLKSAEKVIAVSNDAARAVASLLGGRTVEAWPFPIDTDLFKPSTLPRKRQLLFVGRAGDPRKRLSLFLDALELLRRNSELEAVRVIVVSAMPIDEALCEAYKELMPSIDVLGGLSVKALAELYATSTALVITSEQEGLSIATMEAMSSGTPVISTRCGGPEMLIEEGVSGFLVDATSESVASRISELLLDPPIAASLGSRARERMLSKFSEKVWNQRFEELLRLSR